MMPENPLAAYLPEQQARRANPLADSLPGQPPAEPASMGLGEMGSQAWENLGPSAKQYGSDLASMFTDPVGTAKGLYNVAAGGVQKLIPGEQSKEKYADAFGAYASDRFGGWENIKRTIATDPVGAAGDLAAILSGGGFAAARLPGLAGRVGKIAGKVGSAVDPVNAAVRGVGLLGKKVAGPVARGALGMTTGTGPTAIPHRRGFRHGRRRPRHKVPRRNARAGADGRGGQ